MLDLSNYYLIEIGTFDDDLEDYVLKSLEKAHELSKPVLFLINSPGGDLPVLISIISHISLLKISCIAINAGRSDSAAAFLQMFCETSYAAAGTTMCLHYGNYGFSNSDIHASMKKKKWPRTHLRDTYNHLIGLVSRRSGLKKKKIMKILSQERRLTAKQAKKLGFIDHILKDGDLPDGI